MGVAENQLVRIDIANLEHLEALAIAANPIENLEVFGRLKLRSLLVDPEQLAQLRSLTPAYVNSNPVLPLGQYYVIGKVGMWGI